MQRFRDLHREFLEAGAEVIGASVDTQELNAEFRDKEDLPFVLVSDPTRELCGELGILWDAGERGMIAKRVTYLIDQDGTIAGYWEVGTGDAIDVHPDEVLAAVKRQKGANR